MESEEPTYNWETEPEVEEEEGGHSFWPTHVLDQVMIFYLLGGVLITLAILLPFHLHEPADPMRTPEGIKPEWYFLPMYQAIKYVPKVVGIALTTLAALFALIWPFLDAVLDRRIGIRTYRKIGAVAVILVMSLLGYISERSFTVGGQKYSVDMLGLPHRQASAAEVGETAAPEQTPGPTGSSEGPASATEVGEPPTAGPTAGLAGPGEGPASAAEAGETFTPGQVTGPTGSSGGPAPAAGVGEPGPPEPDAGPPGLGGAGGDHGGG